jgi:hypothetical protein
MASLPEVQPAPKKHRIGQKAGQALELGLAQVAAANVLKKVEQHLNRNPHLIPKVAGMISSDLLTPQPDLPQPSGTPTEIPQPMVRFWQLPAFRLDLMLKEMEPDLFNTMLQQINTETKRNLFYFALNVNGQMRIDKPDPPYWSTFQNNSVNAYRHLGKRMSSALRIQDDTVHVHPNFLLDNGAVNWASTIGHFIISTGHPETVVLLSVPAQTQLTHTHTHCQELINGFWLHAAHGPRVQMTTAPWSWDPTFVWKRLLSHASGRSTATGTMRKPRLQAVH